MKFLRRLICWKKGHRRGVLVRTPLNVSYECAGVEPSLRTFECPRCGATWTRQTRKAKAAA